MLKESFGCGTSADECFDISVLESVADYFDQRSESNDSSYPPSNHSISRNSSSADLESGHLWEEWDDFHEDLNNSIVRLPPHQLSPPLKSLISSVRPARF